MNITRLLPLILCVLLTACASITPLKSRPPYSEITVNRPFSWGDGIWKIRVDMPAGIYTPLYEDDDGYFYQAPQKVTGRDAWMPLIMDGGLYLERDRRHPEKIYIIRGQSAVPGKIEIGKPVDLTLHP